MWKYKTVTLPLPVAVLFFSARESRGEREREIKEAPEKAKKVETPEERDEEASDRYHGALATLALSGVA